jgi:uncharacterized protein (TIGR02231 family)
MGGFGCFWGEAQFIRAWLTPRGAVRRITDELNEETPMLRKMNALLGLALWAACNCSHAQGAAPITAVTLYPGSATIVRTARVDPGATRLVLAGLPANFSMQTFRIEADAGIRVGQIDSQDVARTESGNAAEAALDTRIQALKDEIAALEVQEGAADIVKSYLERAGGDPAGTDRQRAPAEAKSLAATIGAINQAALDALGKKQKVAVQKREIQKRIEALERDRQKVRGDSRESRTVTIELATQRGGAMRVSYQVNAAGWRPAYRAELDSTASTVTLDRLAQVSQKTGEDWRGVRLALSTVQPRATATAVVPTPWLLSYSPPRSADDLHQRMPAPAPAPAAAMMLRSAAQDGEPPYIPPTFQVDSAFATEFVVPTPVTLPSDGREISLALSQVQLKAKQRVQVAPRVSLVPVVMAETDRPAGVWPDGNLQLFRDGGYLGASAWHPQGTEKWSLSFGRDDLLQVRIDPIKGDSASTGVFDKRNVRRIADQITLRNNHTAPVDVIVIEASPVSTSDEVKVQATFNPKPAHETWDQRRGVVAWERTVPPQQSVAIDVGYSIEYPKEGVVGGLR